MDTFPSTDSSPVGTREPFQQRICNHIKRSIAATTEALQISWFVLAFYAIPLLYYILLLLIFNLSTSSTHQYLSRGDLDCKIHSRPLVRSRQQSSGGTGAVPVTNSFSRHHEHRYGDSYSRSHSRQLLRYR